MEGVQILSRDWLFSCSVMPDSFTTLWTVARQASLSTGFPRQDYWSGLPFPFPGDLPNSEIEPKSPAWKADSLLLSHQGSKEFACQCRSYGRHRFDSRSGRSLGEGNGSSLQYSCQDNSEDRRAWRATAHSVPKSPTRLSGIRKVYLLPAISTVPASCLRV